ncbi:MAG: pyruvate kinase, partial [Promethearchaeota archaeon]
MIKSLIDAGVDVFRLNFSHGTHKEKGELIVRIRSVDDKTRIMAEGELIERIRSVDDKIGIMADIQGPKIRVGKFKNDEAYILNVGQEVKVFESEIPGGGDQTQFSIPLVGFLKSMKKGNVFFVNDGIIKIEIKSKEKDHLIGEVIAGGIISNNKGVNIPAVELNQSVPTEKDIKDLEFIADINPEFVAIS